jgi:hypothetical protein
VTCHLFSAVVGDTHKHTRRICARGLSLRRPLAWRRNEHSARINSGLARIFDGLAALEENNNDTGRKHMAEATATDLLGKAAYVSERFSTASSDDSGLSTGNFTVTAVPSPGLL